MSEEYSSLPSPFATTLFLRNLLCTGPLVVLVAGILLSTLAGFFLNRWVAQESDKEFVNASFQIATAIEREIDVHIEALRGLQGLFAASDSVTRAEFVNYAELLDQSTRLADVQGVGFARHITSAQRTAYEAQMKHALAEEGESTKFAIWPAGVRADYLVVDYIQPAKMNSHYAGRDLLTVPERKDAIARTRKTHQPALSARLSGVGETGSFALIAAVPSRPGQAFPGTVQMIFRPQDMFGSIGQSYFNRLNVEVYESADAAQREDGTQQVYGSMWGDRGDFGVHVASSAHKRILPLKIADREWTLVVSALPGWHSDAPVSWLAPALTMGGVVITLLLALFAASLLTSRQRAEARFDGTFDFAPVGLLIVNRAGTILRANPKAEAMFGYGRGMLDSRPLSIL